MLFAAGGDWLGSGGGRLLFAAGGDWIGSGGGRRDDRDGFAAGFDRGVADGVGRAFGGGFVVPIGGSGGGMLMLDSSWNGCWMADVCSCLMWSACNRKRSLKVTGFSVADGLAVADGCCAG